MPRKKKRRSVSKRIFVTCWTNYSQPNTAALITSPFFLVLYFYFFFIIQKKKKYIKRVFDFLLPFLFPPKFYSSLCSSIFIELYTSSTTHKYIFLCTITKSGADAIARLFSAFSYLLGPLALEIYCCTQGSHIDTCICFFFFFFSGLACTPESNLGRSLNFQ
jgi:hypothetical protein